MEGDAEVMRRFDIAVALLCMLSVTGSASCSGQKPEYVVEPGLVKFLDIDGESRAQLVERTNRIQKTTEPLEGMGFLISSRPRQSFVVHTVHFLPGTPAKIGQMTFEGYTPEDATKGMKTKPVGVSGGRYFFWGFDEADPLGEYRIDVYVNGELLENLVFEVVEEPPSSG